MLLQQPAWNGTADGDYSLPQEEPTIGETRTATTLSKTIASTCVVIATSPSGVAAAAAAAGNAISDGGVSGA